MNPIPLHLRHLEALFDHYNVGARGHFLGESTTFYLSSRPKLPLLPSQGSSPPTQTSSITDQPQSTQSNSTNPNGSLPVRSKPQLSSPSNDADPTGPSSSTLTPDPGTHPGGTTNAQAYHDPDFPAVANSQAVLSQLPPPALARELIVLFLSKPNRFMPIIPTLFLEEYDAGIPQSPFLLLAIYAITSKYSSDPMHRSDVTRAQTAGETYCRTACRLVDEFLDCPRLSTVQGLFLLGKHLEESKNQNVYTKSFMYIGMAVRMAMDMGLNRNCTGWGLEPIQMEYRNRTWWYLYVYDRAQSSCYGRPYLIQDHDCGASKPQPDPLAKNVEEDQADVEHLLHLIHLSTLLGRVITTFYPSNPSVCNFYSSKRFCHNSPEDRAMDSKSTTGRKRSKTTNSKNKARDLDESPSVFDATHGHPSTPSDQDHHKEMLARQQLANQKQDELVIELDKELTEWVQSLPAHLQWSTLQEKPSAFGDVLHGIYYAILILLHRPSIRVGELLPTTPYSKQNNCSTSKPSLTTTDGCHSLAVCAQAARRITRIAERCQSLTHLERFGGGAYILLHAARIHLLMAAIPCPPRNDGTEGGLPSQQFMKAVRSKEEAVDMFHRSLGSLRKFSIYHWTVDGISLSIRAMERTLAAILQEQELDKEQELQHQKQLLLDYDSDFMDRDPETSDSTSNTVKEEQLTEAPTLPEEPLHEIAYFKSMRFLEMRALYRERHHFTEEGSLEQHLQYQLSQSQPRSQLNADINLASRRSLLDGAAPAMTYRHVLHNISDLFNKNDPMKQELGSSATSGTNTPLANVPGLVIRTYKPNTTGRTRRRTVTSTQNSNTTTKQNKASTGSNQQKSTSPTPTLDEGTEETMTESSKGAPCSEAPIAPQAHTSQQTAPPASISSDAISPQTGASSVQPLPTDTPMSELSQPSSTFTFSNSHGSANMSPSLSSRNTLMPDTQRNLLERQSFCMSERLFQKQQQQQQHADPRPQNTTHPQSQSDQSLQDFKYPANSPFIAASAQSSDPGAPILNQGLMQRARLLEPQLQLSTNQQAFLIHRQQRYRQQQQQLQSPEAFDQTLYNSLGQQVTNQGGMDRQNFHMPGHALQSQSNAQFQALTVDQGFSQSSLPFNQPLDPNSKPTVVRQNSTSTLPQQQSFISGHSGTSSFHRVAVNGATVSTSLSQGLTQVAHQPMVSSSMTNISFSPQPSLSSHGHQPTMTIAGAQINNSDPHAPFVTPGLPPQFAPMAMQHQFSQEHQQHQYQPPPQQPSDRQFWPPF